MLGEDVLIGSARPELSSSPLRCLSLKRFPYLLAYDPEREPPLIVRLLHAARDLPTALAD